MTPVRTYGDVQVAGTGDAGDATALIAIQPKGLAHNSRWQAPRRHRNFPHARPNPDRVADDAEQHACVSLILQEWKPIPGAENPMQAPL